MKRNTFIYIIFWVAAIFLGSCSGNQADKTLGVDKLLTDAELLTGQIVTVEAVCTHVCSKSGMKLFLNDGGDQTVRVESNSTIGKFDKEAVDKTVRVRGTLVEERIDEAYYQKLEEEIRNNTLTSHGEGCETEQKAEGVATGSSEMERVNNFRARITERKTAEGKDYLSFYHIAAVSYKVVE